MAKKLIELRTVKKRTLDDRNDSFKERFDEIFEGTTREKVEETAVNRLDDYFKRKLDEKTKKYFTDKDFDFLFKHLGVNAPRIFHWFILGARNIGKTTAAKRYCERIVKQGRRFIWMRTLKEEIDTFKKSEDNEWFADNEWKREGNILKDKNKEVVGYLVSLSSAGARRSVNFPGLGFIYYDEFITDKDISVTKERDNTTLLGSALTTMIRNIPDMIVAYSANYISEDNCYLNDLKLNRSSGDDRKIILNFGLGVAAVYIPDNAYYAAKNVNNAAFAFSMYSETSYARQNTDTTVDLKWIKSRDSISAFKVEPNFTLFGQELKYRDDGITFTFYLVYEPNKKNYLWVEDGIMSGNNLTAYALSEAERIKYNCAYLNDWLKCSLYDYLQSNRLYFANVKIRQVLVDYLYSWYADWINDSSAFRPILEFCKTK